MGISADETSAVKHSFRWAHTFPEKILYAARDYIQDLFTRELALRPAQFDAYMSDFPHLEVGGPHAYSDIWEALIWFDIIKLLD